MDKPLEFVDLKICYHTSRKPLIVYSEWNTGLDYEYAKSKFLIKICKKYDVPLDILRAILTIFTDLAQAKKYFRIYMCGYSSKVRRKKFDFETAKHFIS